jgi:hypothetical protein
MFNENIFVDYYKPKEVKNKEKIEEVGVTMKQMIHSFMMTALAQTRGGGGYRGRPSRGGGDGYRGRPSRGGRGGGPLPVNAQKFSPMPLSTLRKMQFSFCPNLI